MTKRQKDLADPAAPPEAGEPDWFRASDEMATGYIKGVTFRSQPKKVEYSIINGRAIFEGDICLGDASDIPTSPSADASGPLPERGVAITGERFRWPGGIVPWESQPATRDRAVAAIRHWEEKTRIRFPERTPANATQFPNFISFQVLDGCWSQVGMQGGLQQISLGSGCGVGQAIHEIGHSVGLWHEQSREDRNSFITVQWANIQAGRESQFTQHITDGDDIGPYDYRSVMHYPSTAFSSNGQPTIVTTDGQTIGQRDGLSDGDIAAVRMLYPMLEPSQTWKGVQFTGTVGPNQTRTWFTHSWPAYWFVVWSIVSTAPVQDNSAQVEWTVRVERQTDALLKYYLSITNLTAQTITAEARYNVLGWSPQIR